jgi:hypothetical protein
MWIFDNVRAFDFAILSGASSNDDDDVISGLSGSEPGLESIPTWRVTTLAGFPHRRRYQITG